MAALGSSAQVSTGPFNAAAASHPPRRGTRTCAALPRQESRRAVSLSLLLLSGFAASPPDAVAGGPFDKYVKKKKLEPLEAYVPAVILTRFQIKDLERSLDGDEQPRFAECRSLLRSGPASSFRVNIRAVAQYASDAGNGEAAFSDVDQCLRALEQLDSFLLRATRKDPAASVKSMKAQIDVALDALDKLLQTVPSDVLSKGRAVADAYRTPEDVDNEVVDPELNRLESLL